MAGRELLPPRERAIFAKIQQMVDGLLKHCPPDATFRYEGQTIGRDALVAKFQALLVPYADVKTAATAFAVAVQKKDKIIPTAKAELESAAAMLRAEYGVKNQDLLQFGVAIPKARRPLTATEKVVAQKRRLDTRKARGTLGRKQRLAITTEGEVGVAVVDPSGKMTSLRDAKPGVPLGSTDANTASPPAQDKPKGTGK